MTELKEKAKTYDEIKDWVHLFKLMRENEQKWLEEHKKRLEVKWVRLEDAEQEIEEKSENYAKLCARLHEQVIDLTLKNKELKQKLQQVVKEIPSCIDCEYYLGDEEGNGHCSLSEQQHVDSVCCLKDKFLNELPKKFEELLKEAKP